MILSVRERLLILGLLPKETNFITLRVIRELQSELSFSDEEIKEMDFKANPEGNSYFWNPEKEKEKDINLGFKATEIIRNNLIKMDKENKLKMDHFSICEKFQINEEK